VITAVVILTRKEYDAGMDNKILTLVYTFFLGLMLALFVGLGISTFYESPKPPEYPITLETKAEQTPADTAKIQKYESEIRDYEKVSQTYNRNVSIIALVSAVILLAISLAFERYNAVIANGVLLGGLFTLLYSIGRGFASQDSKMTFVTVSVGLIIAIYLGYRRFAHVHPPAAQLVTKKKRP
jgi:hypothetical protein